MRPEIANRRMRKRSPACFSPQNTRIVGIQTFPLLGRFATAVRKPSRRCASVGTECPGAAGKMRSFRESQRRGSKIPGSEAGALRSEAFERGLTTRYCYSAPVVALLCAVRGDEPARKRSAKEIVRVGPENRNKFFHIKTCKVGQLFLLLAKVSARFTYWKPDEPVEKDEKWNFCMNYDR